MYRISNFDKRLHFCAQGASDSLVCNYKTECTSSKVIGTEIDTREIGLEFYISCVATPVKFTLPSDFDPPPKLR